MVTSIITVIGSIAGIVGGIITYKNSANRQRQVAEKDIAKKESDTNDKKAEIRASVHGKDDNKVNEIVSSLLSVIACCMILTGCLTKPQIVYVPSDRRIESCTNSIGVACKAVPDAVFCELLEKVVELQSLKTEMAVDKRLQK